jgi:hypothetical protein
MVPDEKLPFYYPIEWKNNKLYVNPPSDVFESEMRVIGIVHTHYAYKNRGWGGMSPEDLSTASMSFNNIPYFQFGGFNDICDSRSFKGIIGDKRSYTYYLINTTNYTAGNLLIKTNNYSILNYCKNYAYYGIR